MRIAHVVSTFPPYKGGMGNSVYHSVLEMDKLGHENVIFTPDYGAGFPAEEPIGERGRVIRLRPLFSVGNAAVVPQLMWLLSDFDVIHLHYPFYGSVETTIIGWIFSRARFMVHYHMDTIGRGTKGFIFRLYAFFGLPVVARLAKVITCASIDYVKSSALGAYYKNHKEKFIQIPFGVNSESFSAANKVPSSTILFVGGLDRQHYFKGVDHLIDAFATIKNHMPDARLVIIGKGDLEDYYRGRIAARNLGSRVALHNSVSDAELAGYYRNAAVTVLPSINCGEAFGLVLLESLASGTPVIASNLPGVRNVFRKGEHGYLVKPGDVEDLAEKLLRILSDRDHALKMGAAGQWWVRREYSWRKFSQRLEAAYCRVLYTPRKTTDTNSED